MRRPLVLRSADLVRLLVVVVLLGTLVAGASLRPTASTAQDADATPEGAAPTSLVDVVLDPMPLAPSFVRLIRITMQPGSSIPMRSHPGPKIDQVEAGTLTAVVRDEGNTAAVTIGGAAEAPVEAGQDVALATGDVIVLPTDTFYAFRNDGDEPVVLLSTIMLPAGHQRPPGITYADGEPAADAYDGVTNQILGDGRRDRAPGQPGPVHDRRGHRHRGSAPGGLGRRDPALQHVEWRRHHGRQRARPGFQDRGARSAARLRPGLGLHPDLRRRALLPGGLRRHHRP